MSPRSRVILGTAVLLACLLFGPIWSQYSAGQQAPPPPTNVGTPPQTGPGVVTIGQAPPPGATLGSSQAAANKPGKYQVSSVATNVGTYLILCDTETGQLWQGTLAGRWNWTEISSPITEKKK